MCSRCYFFSKTVFINKYLLAQEKDIPNEIKTKLDNNKYKMSAYTVGYVNLFIKENEWDYPAFVIITTDQSKDAAKQKAKSEKTKTAILQALRANTTGGVENNFIIADMKVRLRQIALNQIIPLN